MQMMAYEVHAQKALVNFINLGVNSIQKLKNIFKKYTQFSYGVEQNEILKNCKRFLFT